MTLAEYLYANRLTATVFAARIGRSIPTVSKLARGIDMPGWDTMAAIVEATDGQVQPNDFLAVYQDAAA